MQRSVDARHDRRSLARHLVRSTTRTRADCSTPTTASSRVSIRPRPSQLRQMTDLLGTATTRCGAVVDRRQRHPVQRGRRSTASSASQPIPDRATAARDRDNAIARLGTLPARVPTARRTPSWRPVWLRRRRTSPSTSIPTTDDAGARRTCGASATAETDRGLRRRTSRSSPRVVAEAAGNPTVISRWHEAVGFLGSASRRWDRRGRGHRRRDRLGARDGGARLERRRVGGRVDALGGTSSAASPTGSSDTATAPTTPGRSRSAIRSKAQVDIDGAVHPNGQGHELYGRQIGAALSRTVRAVRSIPSVGAHRVRRLGDIYVTTATNATVVASIVRDTGGVPQFIGRG